MAVSEAAIKRNRMKSYEKKLIILAEIEESIVLGASLNFYRAQRVSSASGRQLYNSQVFRKLLYTIRDIPNTPETKPFLLQHVSEAREELKRRMHLGIADTPEPDPQSDEG